MQLLGSVIAASAGGAIFLLGVLYLVRPRSIAGGFGMPMPTGQTATGWLRVKGLRDLATGLAAGVLLVTAPQAVLGWVLLAFCVVPIGDAVVVLSHQGNVRMALAVHGTTALIMLLGAVLLIVP